MVRHFAYEAEGWGVGELVLDDGVVVWHELPRPQRARPGARPLAVPVSELLLRYFAGEAVSLADVPIDLEFETPFFERCARALRAVPRGEVVTYGELAALAGAPGAARAAGSFCARSHLSIFVPCHRVVAADGRGSHGFYGVEYQRRLLALDGCSRA